MIKQENNYAFIDSQNLNLGIQKPNLLKQTAKEKIWFMNELRYKLEYKKKNTD